MDKKIRFAGEADELPGTIPGDVIFVVQEKEHETFKRKGSDLLTIIELELSEALCGFVKTIQHMDGRSLKIESPAGKVIVPDSLHCIPNEGMPYHGNPFTKGRLFIQFKVNFPDTLSTTAVNSILNVLPKQTSPQLNGEEEECTFNEVDIEQFGQGNERMHHEAHDEDDDEPRGGQRVQCQNCIS